MYDYILTTVCFVLLYVCMQGPVGHDGLDALPGKNGAKGAKGVKGEKGQPGLKGADVSFHGNCLSNYSPCYN